ncbi:MAG: hypothetical protein WD793_07280 [Steroidobacteraceae bacterium]
MPAISASSSQRPRPAKCRPRSNFLGTAREGTIDCVANATHLGRTTQLWDAVVTHRQTGKTIALYRCTQLLIYPQGSA